MKEMTFVAALKDYFDAREYECEHCGERAVYGAEELLFMIA